MPGEMLEIFRHVFDGMGLPVPPRTRKLDDDTEATIDRVLANVQKLLREEWADRPDDMKEGFKLLRRVRGWYRIGYRAAVERYKDLPVFHVCNMFQEIEKAANSALKHAEGYEKLSVEIDLDKGLTRVLLVEPEYPDDDE